MFYKQCCFEKKSSNSFSSTFSSQSVVLITIKYTGILCRCAISLKTHNELVTRLFHCHWKYIALASFSLHWSLTAVGTSRMTSIVCAILFAVLLYFYYTYTNLIYRSAIIIVFVVVGGILCLHYVPNDGYILIHTRSLPDACALGLRSRYVRFAAHRFRRCRVILISVQSTSKYNLFIVFLFLL